MHIVRVIANVEPGGAQLSAIRLTRALQPLGWHTRFLAGSATRSGLDLFARCGFDLDVFDLSHNLQHVCSPAFADWLKPRLKGADLVHGHMVGAWWACSRAVTENTPVVGSEHNAYQWPSDPPVAAIHKALQRLDLLFVHGPTAREQVLELGADPARLREGRSSIDLSDGLGQRELPQRRIVYVGRLHQEKGPDLLLRALALLDHPVPTYLVGSGPMEAELRALAAALEIEPYVSFTGWQVHPAEWLHGAAACVVPSRFDAWSQSAVLAMRLRVPVVGTNVEGLGKVLSDGRGLAVAPDDPSALASGLCAILDGRQLPDLEAAYRYGEKFAPVRVAQLYDAAYRELLARPDAAAVA